MRRMRPPPWDQGEGEKGNRPNQNSNPQPLDPESEIRGPSALNEPLSIEPVAFETNNHKE